VAFGFIWGFYEQGPEKYAIGSHARSRQVAPYTSTSLRASVKGKLNSPEGIDAASFLYQAVQAYDFYQLHLHNDCQLQIGGSDQWGNITAGIDLIEKLSPETKGTIPPRCHAHVFRKGIWTDSPVITLSNGRKVGEISWQRIIPKSRTHSSL
jgi:tyrosyl-tRNA synthetase